LDTETAVATTKTRSAALAAATIWICRLRSAAGTGLDAFGMPRIIALEQGGSPPRSTNELAFDWSGDGTWCELRENHVLRQDDWSGGPGI
jgi:hypothetical protein